MKFWRMRRCIIFISTDNCVSYLSIYLDIGVIFFVGKNGVDRKNNARYAS